MRKVVKWRKRNKYTHQALISDTLTAMKILDARPTSGKLVVEVAEMLLACLRVALIERGQVPIKGLGTLVVNSPTDICFVPNPLLTRDLTLTQLSSDTRPLQSSSSPDEPQEPHPST